MFPPRGLHVLLHRTAIDSYRQETGHLRIIEKSHDAPKSPFADEIDYANVTGTFEYRSGKVLQR